MWTAMELVRSAGLWKRHGSYATLAEAKSAPYLMSGGGADVYYFWDGDFPSERAVQDALLQEAFAANGGRLLRVTIGLQLSLVKPESASSSCPGNCFCVAAHGSRRCETYYCNKDNVCWWVPCGMGC